jgi:hypothetical protein
MQVSTYESPASSSSSAAHNHTTITPEFDQWLSQESPMLTKLPKRPTKEVSYSFGDEIFDSWRNPLPSKNDNEIEAEFRSNVAKSKNKHL